MPAQPLRCCLTWRKQWRFPWSGFWKYDKYKEPDRSLLGFIRFFIITKPVCSLNSEKTGHLPRDAEPVGNFHRKPRVSEAGKRAVGWDRVTLFTRCGTGKNRAVHLQTGRVGVPRGRTPVPSPWPASFGSFSFRQRKGTTPREKCIELHPISAG